MPNENTVDITNDVVDNTTETNETEIVLDDTTTTNDTDTVVEDDKDKTIKTLSIQKSKKDEKIKVLEAELAKYKKPAVTETKVAPVASSTEDVTIARLEARGFIDSDEQDAILKASKVLGVSPVDALKDELVLAQIERIRNNKKTQAAVPDSRGRSNAEKKGVEYYIQKGIIPEDEDTFNKFIDAQRAKDREGRITRR